MLASSDWNVEAAVALWYQSQEEDAQEADDDDFDNEPSSSHAPPQQSGNTLGPGGGHILGSGSAAPPSAPVSSSSNPTKPNPKPQGGMRTLRDIQSGDHDHSDDDEDHNPDLFAGGEKSGLAVQNPGQNPRDLMNQLLQRARDNAPHPGGDDAPSARSHFSGRGITLGGEGQESTVIDDPNAAVPQPLPRANRTLHIWRNGFSVDDGPLHHNDDPENQEIMREFLQGRAPLHILNVQHGQEVNVEMDLKQDQDYVKPKAKYKPFSGSGQRLGSPTPGVSSASAAASSSAAPTQTASSAGASASGPSINEGEPTVTLQIRLGDGTRLTSRFNTSHTIGDVYGFVNAASPESRQREYVLQTTFPSMELLDQSQTLGDMAEFKRGGVVVQKWK